MKVKKLVQGPDGKWREQYVDKGPSKALANHGTMLRNPKAGAMQVITRA